MISWSTSAIFGADLRFSVYGLLNLGIVSVMRPKNDVNRERNRHPLFAVYIFAIGYQRSSHSRYLWLVDRLSRVAYLHHGAVRPFTHDSPLKCVILLYFVAAGWSQSEHSQAVGCSITTVASSIKMGTIDRSSRKEMLNSSIRLIPGTFWCPLTINRERNISVLQ